MNLIPRIESLTSKKLAGNRQIMSLAEYIYGSWLPNSTEYARDNRPHFEILGEKYKNNDPESEEEIWIPVKGR